MVLDVDTLCVSRSRLVDALASDGVTGLFAGYQNVHLLPVYQ